MLKTLVTIGEAPQSTVEDILVGIKGLGEEIARLEALRAEQLAVLTKANKDLKLGIDLTKEVSELLTTAKEVVVEDIGGGE